MSAHERMSVHERNGKPVPFAHGAWGRDWVVAWWRRAGWWRVRGGAAGRIDTTGECLSRRGMAVCNESRRARALVGESVDERSDCFEPVNNFTFLNRRHKRGRLHDVQHMSNTHNMHYTCAPGFPHRDCINHTPATPSSREASRGCKGGRPAPGGPVPRRHKSLHRRGTGVRRH